LRAPLIVVNFKAYAEAHGPRAMHIAGLCAEVARQTDVCIAVAPPMVELSAVASSSDIPVLSQHVDPYAPGSFTGWVTAEMVEACGAVGTILNHSEHRLSLEVLEKTLSRCEEVGLEAIVCAEDVEMAKRIASLFPPFVAIEPPELIGGSISVTTARPEVVNGAVQAVHSIDSGVQVLCGAGVKTGEDVRVALELGAAGVLLSSGVIKAPSVRSTLLDLVRYL